MHRTPLAILLAISFALPTAALAQNLAPIKERQKILKSFGDATKGPAKMLKNEEPFDLAKVKAALAAYQQGAPKLPALFPPDSKTGGDTEALPVIWEKKDDFEGRYKKLDEDARKAEAAITDEISFIEEFPKVVANCGGCHKIYREKK